jgi:hypothetical protein
LGHRVILWGTATGCLLSSSLTRSMWLCIRPSHLPRLGARALRPSQLRRLCTAPTLRLGVVGDIATGPHARILLQQLAKLGPAGCGAMPYRQILRVPPPALLLLPPPRPHIAYPCRCHLRPLEMRV